MFQTMSQIGDTLKGVVAISLGRTQILNLAQAKGPLCDQLMETALQHDQIEMRGTARWLIKSMAAELKIDLIQISSSPASSSAVAFPLQDLSQASLTLLFTEAKSQEISALRMSLPIPENPTKSNSLPALSASILGTALQTGYAGSLSFERGRLLAYFEKCEAESEEKKPSFNLKSEIAQAGLESQDQAHHALYLKA